MMTIIERHVHTVVLDEPRMAASLLNLFFHDCFVNGCDASILLDDTVEVIGEKSAPLNLRSLRGFEVVDDIKAALEVACPATVSCADILAVAARDSVVAWNGPTWDVQLGRRDSTKANFSDVGVNIPSPNFNLSELISAFELKGFNSREMVALSGAHTIGAAHCASFYHRIYNDKDLNVSLGEKLKVVCPKEEWLSNVTSVTQPLDITTDTRFDFAYFKNLEMEMGLLHSDQQLMNGSLTSSYVRAYIAYPDTFHSDFAQAMQKLGSLGILTGQDGEIRSVCRKVNIRCRAASGAIHNIFTSMVCLLVLAIFLF
ncbi:peroxidase P7-like [Pyrus x bretschneideri]|uniref:peroxidase P7-like n=1 Tax=Pyrus x bretschneideri TaxID=225117 RepID=UPI000870AD0C|nr:peroxidase P7-like [Pyrus x bretschneideri]